MDHMDRKFLLAWLGIVLIWLLLILLVSTEAQAKCADCEARKSSTVREFTRLHPKPGPRSIADHICPLACGGHDAVNNLQWQSVNAAAAKDRWERTERGCRHLCTPENSDGRWNRGDSHVSQ